MAKPLLVLVGPPAAGKTRLAKRIAASLAVDVVDTDSAIATLWGPIPEIFGEHGEPFFREKEREEVIKALDTPGVVALGGGAVTHPETLQDLQGHRVALITISPEAVAGRLENDKRPLLSGGLEAWKSLVEARAELYATAATRTFDTSHVPLESVAQDIVSWVRQEEG